MVDKLKELPQKILEWWNKFSSKQKTIIISAGAGVIVAFVILITLLTRPVYEVLVTCESTKEASEITALLEDYDYKVSDDGLQISILKSQKSQATLLLGANNIPTQGYDLSNVTNGGFSATETDKQRQYKLYLESLMETDLQGMSNIKRATVQLNLPENDGTLLSKEEEASAAISIEPDGVFTADNAAAIAQFVKTALGNEGVSKITIIDNEGNLLFSGDEESSLTGVSTGQLSVKEQAEATMQNEVKKVLLGTNEYDLIEVSTNLDLDFSTTEKTTHSYTPADNQSQGVLSHEDIYESEAEGGTAGVPGTDSSQFMEAGACGAAVYSEGRLFVHRLGFSGDALALISLFPGADVVIIEGMKDSTLPKMEVVRRGIGDKPVSNPEGRILIVTDYPSGTFAEKQASFEETGRIADAVLGIPEAEF